MNNPTDRSIFQNAWVVTDLEESCMKWVNEMGIGPFFINDYPYETFDEVTYRGEKSDLSMRVAIAQAGNIQIELIEPISPVCAYRDSVPAGKSGFHHMCVWTHDFDSDFHYMEDLGYKAANTGKIGDVAFAYFDSRPLMGCMLEVVSYNENTAQRFESIAAAAKNWNGADPLR